MRRVVFAFVAGLALASAVAVAQERVVTVRCQRLELVGADGKVRAALYVDELDEVRVEGLPGPTAASKAPPRAATSAMSEVAAVIRARGSLADVAQGTRESFLRDSGWNAGDFALADAYVSREISLAKLRAAAGKGPGEVGKRLDACAALLEKGDGAGALAELRAAGSAK